MRPLHLQRCIARSTTAVPLMLAQVPAGFPSPAEDYLDHPLDFNELLIVHPAATFAVRVQGDSMTGAGIFHGDIAVIDRALTATDGRIVLAILNGEFTLKRYRCKGAEHWLESANPDYRRIDITEQCQFEVWGVVRNSIRMLLS